MVNTTDKAVELGGQLLARTVISAEATTEGINTNLSPYAQSALEAARKITQDPTKRPLEGLERRQRIPSFNDDAVKKTVSAQLGYFEEGIRIVNASPSVEVKQIGGPVDTKEKDALKVREERVTAIALTISSIQTPEGFAKFMENSQTAQYAEVFMEHMVAFLSESYPAYQDYFKDKSPAERRKAVQGCFGRQEFIDQMRVKLDSALKMKTAESVNKEMRREQKIIDSSIAGMKTFLDAIGSEYRIDLTLINQVKNSLDDKDDNLSTVANFIQRYMTGAISQDARNRIQEAFRNLQWSGDQKAATAQEKLFGQYRQDENQKSENVILNLNHYAVTVLQTINEKRGIVKNLNGQLETTRNEFERAVLDIGGTVMSDYIDSRVAGAEIKLKKAVEEAKTKDEVLVGDILENVDSAWKKHKTDRHGITTATIDKSQVRAAFQMLRSDSSSLREVMGYVLDSADISKDQREAMKRLIKDDPENPAVKTMLTSTASLIVRDYIQSGGKLDEAELMAIGKSKEHGWLKDILVAGMQMEPEAENAIRSLYGDEVTKMLKEKREWPDLWEWLQDNVTIKGILQILLIALGLWGGVSVLAPGLLGGLPTIQAAAGSIQGAIGSMLGGGAPAATPVATAAVSTTAAVGGSMIGPPTLDQVATPIPSQQPTWPTIAPAAVVTPAPSPVPGPQK